MKYFTNLVFFLFFACGEFISIGAFWCPANSTLFDGDCYVLNLKPQTFSTARSECRRFPGGDLTTIRSEAQFMFLVGLQQSVGELNHPWTGLVRHSSNRWAFVGGSPVVYMPPRAFSNYPGENCSQINYYAPGIFDSPCVALSSSICQFPNPIPSISVEIPGNKFESMETDELVDGNSTTCLRIPTGYSSFAKMTLELRDVATGILRLSIVSRFLPCNEPDVMVMWMSQPGKFAKCTMITMETAGSGGYYRCRYECVAIETKAILVIVKSGMLICELES